MPQPCNGLAPEERADILRVRPQGALCRNVNGAGVLGQGMGDGLADPPGHMGGDAEASAHIEFFNGPREPDIAFLDHIQER